MADLETTKTSELPVNSSPSTSTTLVGVDNGETVQIPAEVFQQQIDENTHSIDDIWVELNNHKHDEYLTGKTVFDVDGVATERYVDDGIASAVSGLASTSYVDTKVAGKVDKVSGKGLSTNDLTAALKTNYDAAYTHSASAHAPSNAEKNQNAFSNVTVGSTTIAADTATDTLTLVAGSNITLTPDATNDKITFSVPSASGTKAGVTIVYPADSCTTFSSDSGTVTPLAVQKGAKMFAIPRPTSVTDKAITRYSGTDGSVQNSKIIIEDVTNSKDTSKKANALAIPVEGGKKMVYGYCTDQIDGTSFIGGLFSADATNYPYAQGLAIGGTSGNLLWKGSKVITMNDTATSSAAGLMSANDKKKLDGIVGGVPSCTTSDNGKFLRVVNGVAAWSTVPNAEEASF